jgi:hypothetical protein
MKPLKSMIFRGKSESKKWGMAFILCLLLAGLISAQENKTVWIKVERGNVLYLNPLETEWNPVSEKEKILVRTYLFTGNSTVATIETYVLPSNAYFFINDIFRRSRLEVIGALTRIEAEQLPANVGPDSQKTVGLIFGDPPSVNDAGQIPNENERRNAIIWFINQNNYTAALLSLKRMLTRYPSAYLIRNYAEQLFTLYDWLELHGLLLDETKLLLKINAPNEFHQKIKDWHDYAQKKLLNE